MSSHKVIEYFDVDGYMGRKEIQPFHDELVGFAPGLSKFGRSDSYFIAFSSCTRRKKRRIARLSSLKFAHMRPVRK